MLESFCFFGYDSKKQKGVQMTLKSLERTTFISALWGVLYVYWLHWFLLENWSFELFAKGDWQYIYQQWWYEGWVIQGTYAWVFVISLVLALPVWILGECIFLNINYKKWFETLFWNRLYKKKIQTMHKKSKKVTIKKKKSYKEIRPKALSVAPVPTYQVKKEANITLGAPIDAESMATFPHKDGAEIAHNMSGLPFPEDEIDSFDMNDIKPDPIEPVKEDLEKIMQKAHCAVLTDAALDNQTIDYVAVAEDKIYLCQKDDVEGEWLADEERFNNEDPLWYSESSHRISPVTLLLQAQNEVLDMLKKANINMDVQSILIKSKGNIINAEDMFSTWEKLKVIICRTNMGNPEDLPIFGQAFPTSNTAIDDEKLMKIKELFKK